MEYKRIQTYGRKKARGLSNVQQNALTEDYKNCSVDLSDVANCFADKENFDGLIIEIGFGHGEHLLESAENRPNFAFIGCEPFENGVAKAVSRLTEKGLKNVRIYKGDSRDLLDKIDNQSISEVHIMFPDPWPKKRHIKRRLFSVELLTTMDRVLTDGGIVKLASDCEHYIEHAIEVIDEYNQKYDNKFVASSKDFNELKQKTNDWGSTRYEQKALQKGKNCYYMTIKRM